MSFGNAFYFLEVLILGVDFVWFVLLLSRTAANNIETPFI